MCTNTKLKYANALYINNVQISSNFKVKYNLIFSGIQEKVAANKKEETGLTEFLTPELGITNSNEITLQNVHRLRKRTDGKPRSMIVRFTNYTNHTKVFKRVPEALLPEIKDFQKNIYDQIFVNDTNE
jgi:hypothetical protein